MRYKIILVILIIIGSFSKIEAQANTDSIFNIAVNQARNQQYNAAIKEAQNALKSDTKRGDIMVFIANVYSWQEKNDSATIYIEKARKINYKGDDLYDSWTNILLRSKKYDALLQSCNEAESQNYSNTEDLLRKRMIAYSELKQYDKGIELAQAPENEKFLISKPIDDLYTSLLLKRNTNIISANYTLDMLSNDSSLQHLGSLGYSFKVKDHTWAFRANYANRFGKNDVQLETDFYLMLKNEHYMYFNYGYAFNASLFPRNRVGVEYYFPLPAKFEGSVGGRYLNFPTSDVIILTGHLGKYIGKSWLGLRPFYVYNLQNSTSSLSLIGNYRLYGKNELDYWGVEVGIGNSPDDIYSLSGGGFNQLNAYKIKLERNFMINRISDFHVGLGYSREEFGTSNIQFRNRITLELGYKYRMR